MGVKHLRALVLCLCCLLALSSPALAAYDVRFTSGEDSFVLAYEGETEVLGNIVVENKNNICDLLCTYTTSLDSEEKTVPGTKADDWIGNGDVSDGIEVSFTPVQGENTFWVSVSCEESGKLLCTSDVETKKKTFDLDFPYCGDNEITASYESCENCEDDAACTGDETCGPTDERADERGCFTPICGDGYKDVGETAETCCVDAGCGAAESLRWLETYFCGNDGITLNQRGELVGSSCNEETNACEETILGKRSRKSADCTEQGTYCMDDSCGCSEGYAECHALDGCVKVREKKLGDDCQCDSQCSEGFCDSVCKKGLVFVLNADKEIAGSGEDVTLTFSISNPLDSIVSVDASVNAGTGVTVVSSEHCTSVVGSVCRLESVEIGAGDTLDVEMVVKKIVGEEIAVSSDLSYSLGSRVIAVADAVRIPLSDCGNAIAEPGETKETCCLDVPCGEGSSTFTYECNLATHACEKKLNLKILFSAIGIFLSVIALGWRIFVYKKGKFVQVSIERLKGGIPPELLAYVAKEEQAGFSHDQIREKLVAGGWDKKLVKRALKALRDKTPDSLHHDPDGMDHIPQAPKDE